MVEEVEDCNEWNPIQNDLERKKEKTSDGGESGEEQNMIQFVRFVERMFQHWVSCGLSLRP